jgi:hypothetical protein
MAKPAREPLPPLHRPSSVPPSAARSKRGVAIAAPDHVKQQRQAVGDAVPATKLAKHLDLSHQRIHQLVDEHVSITSPLFANWRTLMQRCVAGCWMCLGCSSCVLAKAPHWTMRMPRHSLPSCISRYSIYGSSGTCTDVSRMPTLITLPATPQTPATSALAAFSSWL